MSDTDGTPGFLELLLAERVIGIVRAPSPEAAVATGKTLIDAGIRLVEVSLNTPGALEAITELASCAAQSRSLVGAGTVLDANSVSMAGDAGAAFFVSPTFDQAAVDAAIELHVAAVPGCSTPTEMLAAHRGGASAIKVFPATLWTPDGLANVLRAMPFLRLVPTGGISAGNAVSWFAAGATAVGIGSSLTQDTAAVARLRRAPTLAQSASGVDRGPT
jgi:2-dehydro-3-deoxyphosphogluconate aldolase/(4S)-4-hydroxy-2-oxoglutarate aldolase